MGEAIKNIEARIRDRAIARIEKEFSDHWNHVKEIGIQDYPLYLKDPHSEKEPEIMRNGGLYRTAKARYIAKKERKYIETEAKEFEEKVTQALDIAEEVSAYVA